MAEQEILQSENSFQQIGGGAENCQNGSNQLSNLCYLLSESTSSSDDERCLGTSNDSRSIHSAEAESRIEHCQVDNGVEVGYDSPTGSFENHNPSKSDNNKKPSIDASMPNQCSNGDLPFNVSLYIL